MMPVHRSRQEKASPPARCSSFVSPESTVCAAALIFHSTRTTVPIEMNSPKAGALFWNRVYSTAPITASPSIVRALIAQRGT